MKIIVVLFLICVVNTDGYSILIEEENYADYSARLAMLYPEGVDNDVSEEYLE